MQVLYYIQTAGVVADEAFYANFINRLGEAGHVDRAIQAFNVMRSTGVAPSGVSYGMLMNVCRKGHRPETALEVYEHMRRQGVGLDTTSFVTLLLALGDRDCDAAAERFDAITAAGEFEPDVFSYNSIIGVVARSGAVARARGYFDAMKRDGLAPDLMTYGLVVAAHGNAGQWEEAEQVFRSVRPKSMGSATPCPAVAGLVLVTFGGRTSRHLQW